MKWNKGLSKSLSISFFSTLAVELVFDVVKVYPKIETLWPELSILLVPILQLIGTSIALLIIALAVMRIVKTIRRNIADRQEKLYTYAHDRLSWLIDTYDPRYVYRYNSKTHETGRIYIDDLMGLRLINCAIKSLIYDGELMAKDYLDQILVHLESRGIEDAENFVAKLRVPLRKSSPSDEKKRGANQTDHHR